VGKADVLEALNVGAPVAESDDNLSEYFVSTSVIQDLVRDRFDIVRGAKGSGKSALLKILGERTERYPEVSRTKMVPATNHSGDPVFREVFSEFEKAAVEAEERKIIDAWKLYWLNLILQSAPPGVNDAPGVKELAKEVHRFALRSSQKGLAATLKYALKRMLFPETVITAVVAPGAPATVVTAKYPPADTAKTHEPIPFAEIFDRLDSILRSADLRVWLLLDRLDEAFPGKPELENRALRSLLYAFKDTLGLKQIRIKIFIRDDIYQQVTQTEGFVALTHIAGRASSPIKWDEEGLLSLLVERILWNGPVRDYVGLGPRADTKESRRDVFYSVFEEKVDHGYNKPTTFAWMMSRIRDGNGVMTPRDLIELVRHARTLQLEVYHRDRVDEGVKPLIHSATLKQALARLSADKIQNTLIAEYPHLKAYIERFKDSKAEQDLESLRGLFGEDPVQVAKELNSIGFLERLPKSFRIPFLYRDGAGVTQGKAF
jgi:hypothetical protein